MHSLTIRGKTTTASSPLLLLMITWRLFGLLRLMNASRILYQGASIERVDIPRNCTVRNALFEPFRKFHCTQVDLVGCAGDISSEVAITIRNNHALLGRQIHPSYQN
ncbi:hypothetical protein DENSPDRAFT_700831 [Dentipellis sp. KUC8613]|nr:hypothetical protein DENSPDRAFT_700831 [Dentipellis sp. KUC8613]